MEETLSKFIGESARRHEENSNMIKEIRALTDAAIRNQGASIKTLEIQIGQMSKAPQERGCGSLPSSIEMNPKDHVKSILTTVEADVNLIRRMGSSQYAVSTPQNRKKGSYGPQFSKAYSDGATYIDNSIPRKEKDLGSFTLPCYINNVCFDNAFADLGASVSVMPLSTYLNLGLGELAYTKLTVELADTTVKYPKGMAENVLVGIGDEKINFKSVKPASSLIKRVYMLSLREIMELDLESRLMGKILVLNKSMDPLYGDYIELNVLNVPLELRRDQLDDLMPTIEEGEVIEEIRARNDARMVSKFFRYLSDYDQVVENMDPYVDEGMGEVVVGKPFCEVSCVETKRFDGIITIHGEDESVTYQMVRSHPRFKRHINEQCNKILSLLK
ncbi:mitochondrial proton/calcium exchanger protein-like protein isoform X1, partial [Tanacetum coccineum]